MKNYLLITAVFLGLFVFIGSAFAENIDSVNKYAWSDEIGWINFGCTNCGVSVSDSAITGYAWSENYGWINLNPTTSGISNTTGGNLSGYAWGENIGWINFENVSIDTSTGQFSGTATGDIVGTINFSCTSTGCPVTTDWRLASTSVRGGSVVKSSDKNLSLIEEIKNRIAILLELFSEKIMSLRVERNLYSESLLREPSTTSVNIGRDKAVSAIIVGKDIPSVGAIIREAVVDFFKTIWHFIQEKFSFF